MSKSKFFFNLLKVWFRAGNPVFEIYMRDRKVLDLGCGEGKLLRMDPSLIWGVDLNKERVESLRNEGLKIKEASVTSLPFEDDEFDVVHASNIIEHLDPIAAREMFIETKRVLVKGGQMVIITPMPRTVWNTFGHIKPYPPDALKKLFRKVSLESFDPVSNLSVREVFYYGIWAQNKVTFLLSTIMANLVPKIFAGSYLAVIEKD